MGLVLDIGHIVLQVGDMEEALRLYRDSLGFAVKGEVNPIWTVVTTEGGSLTLYRIKNPVPCVRGDGNSPLNLHVANFEEASASLLNAGHTIDRQGPHGGSVRDAWGNVVGLHDHRDE